MSPGRPLDAGRPTLCGSPSGEQRGEPAPGSLPLRSQTQMEATHQVHHHVLVEGAPPLGRHLAHVHDGLWVIRVHVENGGIHDAGHVSGVG